MQVFFYSYTLFSEYEFCQNQVKEMHANQKDSLFLLLILNFLNHVNAL